MMTTRLLFAAILLLLPLAGCQPQVAPPEGSTSAGDRDPSPDKNSSDPIQPAAEVPLTIKSWDETQQLVAAHKGKVVVVDIWSTWCVPCMREFPNLVQLQRNYPEQVACISVDVDYEGLDDVESVREPVEQFLRKQGAQFENVICHDPADEIYERLKLGSIPAVLVYDQSGQLHKRFDNDDMLYGEEGFTYQQHIVPVVEKLIEK